MTWEGVFLTELADHIALQVKSKVQDRLLSQLASNLCAPSPAVRDFTVYFNETCNQLRRMPDVDNLTLSISQLGSEFRHALRRDLESLAPVIVSARVRPPLLVEVNALSDLASSINLGSRGLEFVSQTNANTDKVAILATIRVASDLHRALHTVCSDEPGDYLACMRREAKRTKDQRISAAEAEAFVLHLSEIERDLRRGASAEQGDGRRPKDRQALAAFALARAAANTLMRPDPNARDAALESIKVAEHQMLRWGEVALTLYRLLAGIRDGHDALTLTAEVLGASNCLPCSSHGGLLLDARCGLRLSGELISRIHAELERTDVNITAPQDLNRVMLAIASEVEAAVARDKGLSEWVKAHQIGAIATDRQAFGQLRTLVLQVESLRRLVRESQEVQSLDLEGRRQALKELYPQILNDSLRIWANSNMMTQPPAISERISAIIDHIADIAIALQERKYGSYVGALASLSQHAVLPDPFAGPIAQYRPLIGALAEAHDEDSLRAAVTAFTSSTCSERTSVRRSACLSTLPGLTVGTLLSGSGVEQVGLFAPVGVDFYWGRTNFGLLLAPIDLGTLVSARIDSRVEPSSDPKFRDVFAPTIALRREWASTGLTYGAALAGVPEKLRHDDVVETRYQIRFSAFLSYGLNWLPLHQAR